MLEQLRKAETDDPMVRPRFAGRVLHDLACKSAVSNEIIKPENLFAALASNGGFSCLMAAQVETAASGAADALTIVETNDGNLYYFGDLPNRYLIESRLSLLSLALGAAQSDGANISLDIVYQAMRPVAQTIGSEDFGVPQLPALSKPDHHQLITFSLSGRYFKRHCSNTRYRQNTGQLHSGLLQDVFAAYKARIDPSTAAQICIEYAVPMAKVDPRRIAGAFG
ncbi:hypothetical protein Brsp01_26440 [Brucella sp. NBRC 12950]|nr:hypothetical protein Brsp01_26440 [Brucella sp. NBRC 12950]